MAEAKIYTMEGKEKGSAKLQPEIFEAEINMHCVREALNQYRANQRRGTACAKTRANVRGGGAKPWRQKGTGRARAGSIRSPLWRGGGVTFGPLPRSYSFKINKKKRRRAFLTILSSLASENAVSVLEKAALDKPRARSVADLIAATGLEGNILFALDESDRNFILSCRNLPKVKTASVESLNVYDLLNADHLVLTAGALKKLEEKLG